MNDKEIQTLATELSRSLKNPEDLNQLCAVLKKISIEAALDAELSDHLGLTVESLGLAVIAVTATAARKSSQKVESLRLLLPETGKAVSSLN